MRSSIVKQFEDYSLCKGTESCGSLYRKEYGIRFTVQLKGNGSSPPDSKEITPFKRYRRAHKTDGPLPTPLLLSLQTVRTGDLCSCMFWLKETSPKGSEFEGGSRGRKAESGGRKEGRERGRGKLQY